MSDVETVRAAFADAVDYFHDCLDDEIADHTDSGTHPDRPVTARDYFRDDRGWSDSTIDAHRLGWAPPDDSAYETLKELGYDDETIHRTGLFASNDSPLWQGRYVFPYFNRDGEAVYAIARCTGSVGGGDAGYDGHPADYMAGKYAKVRHTDDRVPLAEPIWGLQTLTDGEPVVITEGVADAITASAHGYAVLSPVTTQFKTEHVEELVAELDQHDVPVVYVAADNEPPGFTLRKEYERGEVEEPDRIREAVSIPKIAPGPGGGLRTAARLREHGVDARYLELPRPSGGKVDLDDYLHLHDDAGLGARTDEGYTFGPVASARQATVKTFGERTWSRAGLDQLDAGDAAGDDADTGVDREPDSYETVSRSGGSALWSLDVADVAPSGFDGHGDHGQNPIRHPGGQSTTYFYLHELPDGTVIAKDYKAPPESNVYTGVTYLLVEAHYDDDSAYEGRHRDAVEGELSDREVWVAWSRAREKGLLDATDVIPSRALEYVARDRDLYEFDALDDDAGLPVKAHNAALAWANNVWADQADVDTDEDGYATARSYQSRHDAPVETWEDVRYVYEEDVEAGRQAARDLLESRYHFMTVADSDALQVYDAETGVYTDETSEIRGQIYDGLGKRWSTHEANEILAGLRQRHVVDPEDLDGASLDDPHRCVANGVLNMLTGELKDHSPKYHYVTRVPVKRDPDAPTEPYEEFVDDLVDREADRKALFEMVGHALMPDANQRYKKFLILTGDADNGKSQFYHRVEALLNGPDETESNTSSVKLAKLAQNQFSMHSIHGSMANIAGEIDGKKIRKTASLKDIPGGDKVEIEPKGQDSFFAYINTTLMFSANDPPIIGERDKRAIATRIVPVELPYRFVEEPDGPREKQRVDEDELADRLETPEALSGLLNLALAGIERLEANGGDVSLPESPKERLRQYERRADPMREFGEKCLTNAEDSYLVKDDARTLYREFAAAQGHEIGSNIDVLFDALRGVSDLSFGDSYLREPDYSDTDLPLRGWNDERKYALQRVTLTEEGMEYAEAAGLVEDTASDAGGAEPDVLTPGEVGPDCMTNSGRVPPVKGRSAGKFEDRYGNEKVTIEGEDGSMVDLRAEGGTLPAKGATVRVEGARLDTDDLGVVELLVRPTTDVYRLDEDGAADDGPDPDHTTVDTAAADGGRDPPEDREGVRADLDRLADALEHNAATTPDEAVSVPTVWSWVTEIADADRVEQLLDHGVERGRFADTAEGDYYLLDG